MNLGSVVSHVVIACLVAAPTGLITRHSVQTSERLRARAELEDVRAQLRTTNASLEKLNPLAAQCLQELQARNRQADAETAGKSAALIQTLISNTIDIERTLGRRILTDEGKLINVRDTICRLKQHSLRKFNNHALTARNAMMAWLGVSQGLAVMNTACDGVLPPHAPQSTP